MEPSGERLSKWTTYTGRPWGASAEYVVAMMSR